MKFKQVRTVAGLLLQLVSVHAHAESEGGGNPFPFQAPGSVAVQARYAMDDAQERFPDLAGRYAQRPEPLRLLAAVGSEGPILSASSAPGGFDEGTVALAQVRGLERWQAARRQLAEPATVASLGR